MTPVPRRRSGAVRTAGSPPASRAWLAAAAALAVAACGDAPPAAPPAAPAPSAAPAASPAPPPQEPAARAELPTFVDVAEEGGIAVVNHTGKSEKKDWLVSAMGGGTIALDYDSDGDMDLVVVDGTMVTTEGDLEYHPEWITRLFRNDGNLKFTDVSHAAGVALQAFGFGGAACDYDADGHPDFYVCCWGENRLYRNRGDGTFEDVTKAAGVAGDPADMSTSCAWGDVDGDGRHDLYVANYADQRAFIERRKAEGANPLGLGARFREFNVYIGPSPLPPQMDRLYLGQPDGTFREVTATHLLEQRALYGFQPIMTDVDDDGDLDVFVANDTHVNHLWVNDGKGVFRDRAVAVGVATSADNTEQAGMGVDAGDHDRNGRIDLTVTNFSHDYNTIYRNRTTGRGPLSFIDASGPFGIAEASYYRLAWAVRFADVDNDGWLDHWTTCGHVYGEIEGFAASTGTTYRQRCQLLRNQGPTAYKLVDVTERSGPAFRIERVWRGASFGDFDDDGDVDAFVAALNDKAALFRNDGGNRNAFVRFTLVGKGMQRDPAGARVLLHMPSGRVHLEELHHGASFCSDNDPRLLFGLGALTTVPKVEVRWPGGEVQTFTDVAARRGWIVEQGVPELKPDPTLPPR